MNTNDIFIGSTSTPQMSVIFSRSGPFKVQETTSDSPGP